MKVAQTVADAFQQGTFVGGTENSFSCHKPLSAYMPAHTCSVGKC